LELGEIEMNESLHLLFTVLVTEKRLKVHPGLSSLPTRRRVDLLLATLESLNVLPISSADFYLEFDETTEEFEVMVREKIASYVFPFRIHPNRLENFQQWSNASKVIPQSGSLLLFSYDDHAILPDSLEEFIWLKSRMQDAYIRWPELTVMGQLSHFPETVAYSSVMNSMGLILSGSDYQIVPVATPIGAVLVPVEKFISWWKYDFTQGRKFVGPENPFGPSLVLKNGYWVAPKREVFRHLDGYSHVNVKSPIYSPVIIQPGQWGLPASSSPILGDNISIDRYLESIFAVRFSFFGLKYFIRFPLIQTRVVLLRLVRLVFTNKSFAISVIKGFGMLPFLGMFYLLRPISQRYFSSGKHRFTLHLVSSAASHGFLRFSLVTLKEILRKRIAFLKTHISR